MRKLIPVMGKVSKVAEINKGKFIMTTQGFSHYLTLLISNINVLCPLTEPFSQARNES